MVNINYQIVYLHTKNAFIKKKQPKMYSVLVG